MIPELERVMTAISVLSEMMKKGDFRKYETCSLVHIYGNPKLWDGENAYSTLKAPVDRPF